MNLYAHDLSLFDFGNFSDDPIMDPTSFSDHHYFHRSSLFLPSSRRTSSSLHDKNDHDDEHKSTKAAVIPAKPKSPPRHRHDGTSPLPLGMDWSLPPRKWEGRETIWPHDPRTGWSYCVTIPSWVLLPKSTDSKPVAFYRVQVGVQSPEGITTTRAILRRYTDFLKLLAELKKAFPEKSLPPAPPKRLLRVRSTALFEERRCSLEDWMEKLLSDINVSRSGQVGAFLELEAAVRSAFDDGSWQSLDTSSSVSTILQHTNSNISLPAGSSSIISDQGSEFADEISDVETASHGVDHNHDLNIEASTSEQNITNSTGIKHDSFNQSNILEREYQRLDGHFRKLSTGSIGSDLSSVRGSEISNLGVGNLFGDQTLDGSKSSNVVLTKDLIVLPSNERNRLNRVLDTMHQRLATAKTDMEDLIVRFNQEVAVRQFLSMKVKDLEGDLETTKNNCKENMQQAALSERERFTQMQWDVEELRKKCLDLELKLKTEQDEKARVESAKHSVIEENKMLMEQLDVARDEFENLYRQHEDLEQKSKADVKLLVKEVKSLRSSQAELKQELGRSIKDKLEAERALLKEKQRTEHITSANAKLLHECEILRDRLRECSVNFLVEEEDKLIVDTSTPADAVESPSDAIDLLITSDNRIGLLLAEAQLLAQDVENTLAKLNESPDVDSSDRTDDKLRKMLTEIFVDNARLRMQVNSVIRCALNADAEYDKDGEEDDNHLRKTVLSKFL